MKKILVIGLTVFTMACFTACGEDLEEDVATDVAVEAEADVDTTEDIDVESDEDADGPMSEEKREQFISVYNDFLSLTDTFQQIYAKDEVEQNDKYDAYVNETVALAEEINNTDLETLTYSEAQAYVDAMTSYAELYQEYADEIKAALGL